MFTQFDSFVFFPRAFSLFLSLFVVFCFPFAFVAIRQFDSLPSLSFMDSMALFTQRRLHCIVSSALSLAICETANLYENSICFDGVLPSFPLPLTLYVWLLVKLSTAMAPSSKHRTSNIITVIIIQFWFVSVCAAKRMARIEKWVVFGRLADGGKQKARAALPPSRNAWKSGTHKHTALSHTDRSWRWFPKNG